MSTTENMNELCKKLSSLLDDPQGVTTWNEAVQQAWHNIVIAGMADEPKEADKLRKLLCSERFIAEEIAKRIVSQREIIWEQIAASIVASNEPQDSIDILLDLKRCIEGNLIQMTLDVARYGEGVYHSHA